MIHEQLLKFQKLGLALKKDGENPHFHSSYATLNEVLDTVKGPLNDLGVIILQQSEEKGLRTTLLDTTDGTKVESFMPYTETSTAQKLGSNVTYLRRYSLVTLLGLGDNDDDGNESSKPRPTPPQTLHKPQGRTENLNLDPRIPIINEDMPTDPRDAMALICSCGQQKKRVQVKKEGPNKGRYFWSCPKPMAQACPGSFQWDDDGDSRQDNVEGEKSIDYNANTGELLP